MFWHCDSATSPSDDARRGARHVRAQPGYPVLKLRMGAEEPGPAGRAAARDAECSDPLRDLRGSLRGLEWLKSCDHLVAPGEAGSARIAAQFATGRDRMTIPDTRIPRLISSTMKIN